MTEQPELPFSGLPPLETTEKRDERVRLERSREWLKDWHARQAQQPAQEAAE